jgi:DNA-binding NtrC family response regulator
VTVACGALPPDLIESELFGHVRGAFTGADHNKIGRFETAEGGTFLLDEIDLLGPKEQSKLLRVIETGEYEPVGSSETRRTDIRLIVCANVDLNQMMARQKFRADLYYRLNVLEFVIPPLRKRPLDIVPLAIEFIEEFCRDHRIGISRIHSDFLDALERYDWPGNIRELKNHMRRAVLFCNGEHLTPHDLSPVILQGARQSLASGWKADGRPGNLANQVARTERDLLVEALMANGYKRAATARALGISRVGLYKKLKKYGVVELKRETGGVADLAPQPSMPQAEA